MRPIAVSNPPNPWQVSTVDYLGEPPDTGLIVYEDHTKEILSKNDSPDVPFTWSVNPYRGCFHGCAYCYARPTHEYLGFGAGTDFERKIVVKPHAGALLRDTFERKSWKGENIVFSGVTDCYQPLEASYGLTRACLEVCLDYRNPVGIITKSPLVERDIPLLVELGKVATVHVCVSIPFWNESNARKIEPYVTTPVRRMKTVERLAKAGISVTVMVAPIIPGLNDEDIPDILSAAKDAGATGAGRVDLAATGTCERGVLGASLQGAAASCGQGDCADARGARWEALRQLVERAAEWRGKLRRDHRAALRCAGCEAGAQSGRAPRGAETDVSATDRSRRSDASLRLVMRSR